ncbi:unnamed protein product [Rangifer tarandus platyrhynchus]|uniref:Uncharacterized protein n=1 Tax=Rangifer tarandus platyrhynchus TaxID=3082113 RepID=A0ABN8Y4X3_RANTA|nr:unnamed protein product [Rangifer tarandus platyrhynchus]
MKSHSTERNFLAPTESLGTGPASPPPGPASSATRPRLLRPRPHPRPDAPALHSLRGPARPRVWSRGSGRAGRLSSAPSGEGEASSSELALLGRDAEATLGLDQAVSTVGWRDSEAGCGVRTGTPGQPVQQESQGSH